MRKLIIVVLMLVAGVVQAQDDGLIAQAWTFDGLERTYSLHLPEDVDEPAPLVIALHGRFGSGAGMARLTRLNDVADEEGFIVAYPDGLGNEWNFVRDVPGYDMTQDDTAFLVVLVERIAEDYAVDMRRVYLTGFSNGGFMAQRVACEHPQPFAAFASVAAAAFGGMPDVCPTESEIPVPMLLINGTDDNNIRWEGNSVTRNGRTIYTTYPVSTTLSYWAGFNGCETDAETTEIEQSGDSPGTLVRVLTVDCPEETAVFLYGIIGGGHNWPGQAEGDPQIFGNINRDIDASETIWAFFSQFERSAP